MPLLARTTDEVLRGLVQEDLKYSTEAADILKLADRWWERAESSSALSQEGMRRRASTLVPPRPIRQLQGLDAQKVAKRIAETETDWLASWRPYSQRRLLPSRSWGGTGYSRPTSHRRNEPAVVWLHSKRIMR